MKYPEWLTTLLFPWASFSDLWETPPVSEVYKEKSHPNTDQISDQSVKGASTGGECKCRFRSVSMQM